MICPKCYDRGKIYQIDGSITSIKGCDCKVAKEQQANFTKRMDKLLRELNTKLATFQIEG